MIEIDGMIDEINRLTAERDAARAEVAKMREALQRIAEKDVSIVREGDPELGAICMSGPCARIALTALNGDTP